MQLVFTKLAAQELHDAKAYYERLHRGLGANLQAEAHGAAKFILSNPMAWQAEQGEIRRFLLKRFPYKILYAIDGEKIIVIAFMHQHRLPDYWVGRIS